MKLPYVLISIQTSAATEPPDIGRRFIEELIACDERLTPEYLSTDESYKDRYEGVDHFVSNWWAMLARTTGPNTSPSESYWGPLWKRKRKIRSSGHIEHGFINKKNYHLPSRIWFKSSWDKHINYPSLFRAWVSIFKPDIAMLHLFSDPEYSGDVNYTFDDPHERFMLGSFGGPAQPGIPNAGWAMAFGQKYTDIDILGLRNAGINVHGSGQSKIFQITDELSDLIDRYDYFEKARTKFKSHFQENTFLL